VGLVPLRDRRLDVRLVDQALIAPFDAAPPPALQAARAMVTPTATTAAAARVFTRPRAIFRDDAGIFMVCSFWRLGLVVQGR
jgi:hypothetical protein